MGQSRKGPSYGCPPLVILQSYPIDASGDVGHYHSGEFACWRSASSYGRMTGSNEVVALKSMGVSPLDVVWPTLVMTLLFSIVHTLSARDRGHLGTAERRPGS